jgi:MFS family permease
MTRSSEGIPKGISMRILANGGYRHSAVMYICILVACLIAFLSFGVRTSLGVFLEPMLTEREWDRGTFGLAMAIQNLVWGAAQPFAGALADSRGYVKVLIGGAVLYMVGLASMSFVENVWLLHLGGGLVAGIGLAGASWTISVAAAVRIAPPHLQGWATGMAVASCSVGQLFLATLGQAFIVAYGWQAALWIMAGLIGSIIPLAALLSGRIGRPVTAQKSRLGETVQAAMKHGSFWLIFAGFFICGIHSGFVFTHLPAYVVSRDLLPQVGALALAAIGLTNLFSSYIVGVLGQKHSKRQILVWVYTLRTAAILALFLLPADQWVILITSAVLGVFWMSSIPPTSGLLGQVFGSYYIATLLGIVFLGHQVGAFAGAWLGGTIFDRTGSYDLMWWICAGLSGVAALANLPVDERPLVQARTESI